MSSTVVNNITVKFPATCYVMEKSFNVENFLECFAYHFPAFLETIRIGNICATICVTVILISIFGKIKDNYRWFILNQTVWDLFISYDFICEQPQPTEWNSILRTIKVGPPNCFYSGGVEAPGTLLGYIKNVKNFEACIMAFMLSLSRFIAVYCHIFFKKYDTTFVTVSTIVFFNIFFVIFVNLSNIYKSITGSSSNRDILFLFRFLQLIFISLCIILSLIFTIMVLIKIIKNLLYKVSNQDRKKTIASLRIALVLLYHSITISILFSYITVYDVYYDLLPNYNLYVFGPPLRVSMAQWLQLCKNNQKTVNILRVLLDSIAVLTFLTGYRQSLKIFIKSLFHPVRTFEEIRSKAFKISSSVSGLSQTTTNNMYSGNR